jgi:hypothetical protein
MRIDIKYNRLINNTLFSTGNLICQNHDVSHDLVGEIVEFFPWNFFKYTPRLSILILQVIQTKL